jgi:capsular polysaccharide transport system permease protein
MTRDTDERPTIGDKVFHVVSQTAERVKLALPFSHPGAGGELSSRYVARVRALGRSLTTSGAGGSGWWVRSLLALVAAPTVVFFLYASVWQSRGYEAEARLTVREAREFRGPSTDPSGLTRQLTGAGNAKSTIQDAYIVLNYVKSPAILIDLGGSDYITKYFGSSKIDFFSRSSPSWTIEQLNKYWLQRVAVSVDTMSGVVTIKVEAFQPADASAIAQDIVRLSERLVNKISEANRKDTLERAEGEVTRAAKKLAATREQLTVFRGQNSLIDPATRAKNVAEMVAKLTLDKIAIETSLETLEGALRADAPSQRIQRIKLSTIEKQIAALNKSLTDPDNSGALSAQIGAYERLKIDEQFDETMYSVAKSSYLKARQEMERQQLYLVVIVPPTTPEQASYPKIMAGTTVLLISLFILWSIGALIVLSIDDQMV